MTTYETGPRSYFRDNRTREAVDFGMLWHNCGGYPEGHAVTVDHRAQLGDGSTYSSGWCPYAGRVEVGGKKLPCPACGKRVPGYRRHDGGDHGYETWITECPQHGREVTRL